MEDRYKTAAANTVNDLVQEDGLDAAKLRTGTYAFICTPIDRHINKLRSKMTMAKHKTNSRYFKNLEEFLKSLIGRYYGDYEPLTSNEYDEMTSGVRDACPFARCCRSLDDLLAILEDYYSYGMIGCELNGIGYKGIYWLMGHQLR